MFRKLTLLILTLGVALSAFAENFVVTANADAGPGTLRDAIEKANANGTAETDFIQFNLPDISAAGRTIALRSSLPNLLSNLVIDGSTQRGGKFCVSDARIRITTAPGAAMSFVFRMVNSQNVSFFGLHLDDLQLTSVNMNNQAIALQNARKVMIGAPGRGNYFTRLPLIIGDAYFLPTGKGCNEDIVFRSNIVNLSEDGNALVSNAHVFALDNVRNLTLGGEDPAEGNFISTGREYVGWTYTDTNAHVNMGTYAIMNNKFGCNFSQTAALPCGAVYLRNGNSYGFTDLTNIIIKNNSFNTSCFSFSCPLYNYIVLDNKKGFIDIKVNTFGLLSGNSDFFYSTALTAISIGRCENGIIGGDDPADANIIAGQRGYAVALGENKAIRITKNSMFCNSNGIRVSSAQIPVPKTKIFTITDYLVAGTTLPDSKVEVFLTRQCAGCDNGKTYLGHTMADATGNWSFTSSVLLDGAVTATGTSPQGATGEFAKPEYRWEGDDYRHPTCNQNNGYIKGIRFVAGTRYYWLWLHNGQTDTLFTEDVLNAGAGNYRFVVEQGKYCSTVHSVNLGDISPKINAAAKELVQPSCGLNNGAIRNHYLSGSYNKVLWKDGAGNVVGTTQELTGAGPGKYKLVILDTIYGCGDSTELYTLANQAGPTLYHNGLHISAATCSQSNGSIKGFAAANVTGTPYLQWVDTLNNPVGNTFDLLNVPPGRYRLRFKDASGCDTITTPFFTLANQGAINIDTTGKNIRPSSCSAPDGSISGLLISGGESFAWQEVGGGATVGTGPDAAGLAAGSYQLTVSNSMGCSVQSPVMVVPQARFDAPAVTGSTVQNATCEKNNGSVRQLQFDRAVTTYNFWWVNSPLQQQVSVGTVLENVGGGTYVLMATDNRNGCAGEVHRLQLAALKKPSLDATLVQLSADQCSQQMGAIRQLKVNNLQGPTTYAWKDEQNNTVGTSLNLQNIGAGKYHLQVTDGGNCTLSSEIFLLENNDTRLEPPRYADLVIPRNSAGAIQVLNLGPEGIYKLMASNGAPATEQNRSGNFATGVLSHDTILYVQREWGSCISDLVAVKITVVDETKIFVPTAFTPNNDGRNDLLKPTIVGLFQLEYFMIYDRWGNLVFQTGEQNKGWNGWNKGLQAPAGVYVWLIKGKDISGKPVQQKGSFVLMQ